MKLFVALLLSTVLAGCTTYRDVWTPPSSPQGTMCVSNCNTLKQTCQTSEQLLGQAAYQQCQQNYSRELNLYNICKAQYQPGRCTKWRSTTTRDASGKEVTKQVCEVNAYSNPCVEPKRCEAPRNTSQQCETSYRSCYVGCGGSIERVEVK